MYIYIVDSLMINFTAQGTYILQTNKGLVSKETLVLCRWGSETQNFGFIN